MKRSDSNTAQEIIFILAYKYTIMKCSDSNTAQEISLQIYHHETQWLIIKDNQSSSSGI